MRSEVAQVTSRTGLSGRIVLVIQSLILHNEAILPSAERCLTPGQLGLLTGWGVFSTVRVARGVLFAWDRHFARMKRDAENLRMPFPEDADWMERQLLKLVDANASPEATLRVIVVRNGGNAWEGPSDRDWDLMGLLIGLTNWGTDVRLGLVERARMAGGRFSGVKTTAWAMNLVWHQDAHHAGLDEVVLLNDRGEVTECTSANIFAVYGSEVVTPPLSAGCLPGVTREILLNEISIPGLKISERTLLPGDLESADEVFITSTTRDCLPVKTVEGLSIKGGRQVCDQLAAAFTAWRDQWISTRLRSQRAIG